MSDPVAIAILARAPIPGATKTRLIPRLGAEAAARLQAWLIDRIVAAALEARLGPVTLWVTPDADHPQFQRWHADGRIRLAIQPEGDIGDRMAAAADPGRPTLVVGTDCPELTATDLIAAATALREGADAVLIPALDGGYVLIGSRTPCPAMFTNMPWSTAAVMTATRARLRSLGLNWREMPALADLDRPEDYDAMLRAKRVPPPDRLPLLFPGIGSGGATP